MPIVLLAFTGGLIIYLTRVVDRKMDQGARHEIRRGDELARARALLIQVDAVDENTPFLPSSLKGQIQKFLDLDS